MRLFFAYWPSPQKAEEIAAWVRQAHAVCGGRMMRTDTLHMTLAFLGSAEQGKARELAQACSGWRLPAGSMLLEEPGRFRKAKVVWLGPSSADPSGLSWLYEANEWLWSALAGFGWQSEDTPFRPHVSLLRNAGQCELDAVHGPAIHWSPDRCVLVASEPSATGSHYTVLADIPLALGAETSAGRELRPRD